MTSGLGFLVWPARLDEEGEWLLAGPVYGSAQEAAAECGEGDRVVTVIEPAPAKPPVPAALREAWEPIERRIEKWKLNGDKAWVSVPLRELRALRDALREGR